MADIEGQKPDESDALLRSVDSTAPQPQPEPEPAPVRTRSGLAGAVLGGVLAAAAGFVLAQVVPNGWPMADTSALSAQLASLGQETAALKAEVAAISDAAKTPAIPPDTGLADRLTALEAAVAGLPDLADLSAPPDLSALQAQITALAAKLQAIAALPVDGSGTSAAAFAALQAEVQALKATGATLPAEIAAAASAAEARFAEVLTQAEALKAETANLIRSATAQAALGQLWAALDSGTPFAAALGNLGDTPIPALLRENAATGLPTLTALQSSFPDAARRALEAALRANMGATWTERVSGFLRNQTGARSLSPRDGSDPDAILSRAEAALAVGDLTAVLTEIAALPAEGAAAMTDWTAQAEKRLAAMTAVAELAKTLSE